MIEAVPTAIAGWVSFVSLIVMGIFAALNIFDKARTSRNQTQNQADDRLINLLQQNIAALEKRLAEAEKTIRNFEVTMSKLQAENKMLTDVFQGRDKQMQEFMARGFQTMDVVPNIMNTATQTNQNVERLAKLMERHLQYLENKI